MELNRFLRKNGSTILTCTGAVGVVTTAVLSVKATPKALQKLEEAKTEKGEKLTTLEKVKAAGPSYIPAVLSGVGTLACIFGANTLSRRQQAALSSAYALVDASFKEYKAKLKELYGEETHNKIVDAIAVEKADEMYVRNGYMCGICDLGGEGSNPAIFYDEHSGRYFSATIEQVITAEYHLNRNYILRGYAYLNEFYEFLGIDETDYGSVLGWAPKDESGYWIEFNHRKEYFEGGMEYYIIEMPYEPTYDFFEDY